MYQVCVFPGDQTLLLEQHSVMAFGAFAEHGNGTA